MSEKYPPFQTVLNI